MKSRMLLISLAVMLALSMGLVGCGGEDVPEITEYNLTISSTGGGDSTCVPEAGCTCGEGTESSGGLTVPEECLCAEGTEVSLEATPDPGYRFIGWTGDVDTIANVDAAKTTITMNDDYSITANFIALYVLTIDSTDGGDVTTPGEGTFTYDAGAVVNLVAEPEEGYKFLNWTGDIETITDVNAASTTITMEGDCAVTGNFTLEYIYFDMIGPGPWNFGVCAQGVEATVTEEGIAVDYGSNPRDCIGPADEGFGASGRSAYPLKGDFDILMGYELITWPNANGVRVALSILIPDIPNQWPNTFVSIERVSAGPDEYWLGPREVYLVNWNHWGGCEIGTDDLSGTFRIRREGVIVSCYCRSSDSWRKLYEGSWSEEDVYVQMHTFSNEFAFMGKEVSVLMRTVEFVEPVP